jgi:hypothetical protein
MASEEIVQLMSTGERTRFSRGEVAQRGMRCHSDADETNVLLLIFKKNLVLLEGLVVAGPERV